MRHITNIEWMYDVASDMPKLIITWGANSSVVDLGEGKIDAYYKETGREEFGVGSPVLKAFYERWNKLGINTKDDYA